MSKLDAQMGGTPGELDDSAHGSKFPGPKADMEGKPQDLLQEPEYVGKSEWAHTLACMRAIAVACIVVTASCAVVQPHCCCSCRHLGPHWLPRYRYSTPKAS